MYLRAGPRLLDHIQTIECVLKKCALSSGKNYFARFTTGSTFPFFSAVLTSTPRGASWLQQSVTRQCVLTFSQWLSGVCQQCADVHQCISMTQQRLTTLEEVLVVIPLFLVVGPHRNIEQHLEMTRSLLNDANNLQPNLGVLHLYAKCSLLVVYKIILILSKKFHNGLHSLSTIRSKIHQSVPLSQLSSKMNYC